MLNYIDSSSLAVASSVQSLMWPSLLRRNSALVLGGASDGRTQGWLLPMVSLVATPANSTTKALVLSPGEEVATHTATLVREVVAGAGLQLTVAEDLSRITQSSELDILVTTLPRLGEWSLRVERPEDMLEQFGYVVLEQTESQLEQWPEGLTKLMDLLLEEEGGRTREQQLVALADKCSPALAKFVTNSLTKFHKPSVVVADMMEASVYGQLQILAINTEKLERKEEVLLAAAGRTGRLVVCCKDEGAGEHLLRLMSPHMAFLLRAGGGEEKLDHDVQAWALGCSRPLLMTDASLAILSRPPQADTLVLWDLDTVTLGRRLTLVHGAMMNKLRPAVKVPQTQVLLLVGPEDTACLTSLEPWLRRCSAPRPRESDLDLVLAQTPEDGNGATGGSHASQRSCSDSTTVAVFNLPPISLQSRQKQLEKFCMVVLDNTETEDHFATAYGEGKTESREPLYRAYVSLRQTAESTEDQALDSVVDNMVPRGLVRTVKASSRYPKGPDRSALTTIDCMALLFLDN